ncbi:MAG: SusC/RagA family TonB-linked outer membrane protein, partial [Alistipes sp.]|nr:SusC/RagA family TonB-linked outer membrane protein [Alistipes sp.]
SFLGFQSQSVAVEGRTSIDITLVESAEQIDDVVVIGYGTTTKRDLTGAVTQVKAEDLMVTAPTSIQEALRGKAAGVVVTGTGMNPQIRIRGNRSIRANNDPLFVIDGVPQVGGLDLVNPNDVESIEILKDASATAIYGSRGANGVILVSTKQGTKDRVTVTYDAYVNIEEMNSWRPLMDGGQYLEFIRESGRQYIYDGQGGYSINPASNYRSETPDMVQDLALTDVTKDGSGYIANSVREGWAGNVYNADKVRSYDWQTSRWRKTWFSHSHNVNIRGGNEKTQVAISGNFMDNQVRQMDSYRKRYTVNMNLEQVVNKAITVGARANFSYMEWWDDFGVGGQFSPLASPFYSPKNADGSYDTTKPGDIANGIIPTPGGEPLWYNPWLDLDGIDGINKNNRFATTLYTTIKLMPKLTYYASFGTTMRLSQEQRFFASASSSKQFGLSEAYSYADMNRDWNFTQTLTYADKIGDHDFSVMIAQDAFKEVYERLRGGALNLPIEDQQWNQLQNAVGTKSVTTDYTQRTLLSYFARAHYGLKGKYLLDLTYRYDGASVLAQGHKWSGFPSAAFAWRVIDEPFMQSAGALSDLKLRLGYGISGQQSISPYTTVGSITNARYNWGTVGANGYRPSSLSNPNLGWERSATLSLGIDFGLWRGRLRGTLDLYRVHTTDLLMNRSLPRAIGFGSINQNIGETQNQGIELSINSVNIRNDRFTWSTDLTLAYNKEEIVKLYSGMTNDLGNRWFVGHAIHTYYDYEGYSTLWNYTKADMDEMAKFLEKDPGARATYQPGTYRIVDQNGDYRINQQDDRVIRGQKMPRFTGSLSNTFSYSFANGGSLDLFVFAYWATGFTVFQDPGINMAGRYNGTYGKYWTPRDTNSVYIKPLQSQAEHPFANGYRYFKGDYLKIDDITLGYTLPNTLLNRFGISNLRFYAKFRNPFSPITSYPFKDPEGAANMPGSGNFYDNGNSYNDPDTIRTYQLGVQLQF